LHRAARLGDDAQIRHLVAEGADVDALFDIGLDPGAWEQPATPLMIAAGSGYGATVETVELLLEFGASIEPGPSGVSALWYACGGLGWNYPPGGDAERVKALLEAGSDARVIRPPVTPIPGGRRGIGISALARAAGFGDADRVELLLAAGADPAVVGGHTFEMPLHEAARSGSAAVIRLLLDAGAPLGAPIDAHDDPVIALVTSVEGLTALLEAGADPNSPCPYGSSVAEHIASAKATVQERTTMLRLLVASGGDLESPSPAIYGAAMKGDAEAVEALLAAGADPSADPPAMSAVCFSYCLGRDVRIERVIDLLVDAGVDPDDEDERGYRPLHSALSPDTYGPGYQESDGFNAAAVVALLRNGASIDITFPETMYRPLHAAADSLSPTAVEALLKAGADASERTPEGLLALELAREALARLVDQPPSLQRNDHPDPTSRYALARLEQLTRAHAERLNSARRCIALLEAATES
jgi:ankyrin repeat protein